MVTIKDIAKAAGVSPMTVSHVINDHPQVRDSTRAKVLATIDELGYRVNVAARNLRRGRTSTIGLAVPEVDRPYYGQLAAAIITHAERHGLHVVIEQTASREEEVAALALPRLRRYDGLILSTVGLGQADVDLLRVDFPVVILGERIFSGPVDHVAMANVDGAAAAVGHLLDQGARRVAILVGGPDPSTTVSTLRLDGYRAALKEHGIAEDPNLVVRLASFSLAGGAAAVRELLARKVAFDGIFCVTDHVAFGAIRALADAGIGVPQDVRVIGFDDVEMAEYTTPSLSTIDPDHDFTARTAVDLLASRIAGDQSSPHEVISPARVVVRESSG